jgi:ADP-heptose:LPS heptosyltransferase
MEYLMNSEIIFSNTEIKSIVVFRALQLGDMLCVVPALRALRNRFPFAHITLVSLPWASTFASRYAHLVNDFVSFPGYPGLPEREVDSQALPHFFREMRDRHFDLAVQLHGSGPIVNGLLEKMEPRWIIGYAQTDRDRRPNGSYLQWPEQGHEIQKYLDLLGSFGIPSQGDYIDFPLTKEDERELRRLVTENKIDFGNYICIHPGARMRSRRWAPENFAAVGDQLAGRYQIVITGSKDELELANRVEAAMKNPVVNVAGKTSLGGVASLIKRARLLISNDTGVSHIAAAVDTRSVVVTMGSDPARWAPLDSERHVAIFQPFSCRPCSFDICPIGHPCATSVTPDMITEKALNLLQRTNECAPSEY